MEDIDMSAFFKLMYSLECFNREGKWMMHKGKGIIAKGYYCGSKALTQARGLPVSVQVSLTKERVYPWRLVRIWVQMLASKEHAHPRSGCFLGSVKQKTWPPTTSDNRKKCEGSLTKLEKVYNSGLKRVGE